MNTFYLKKLRACWGPSAVITSLMLFSGLSWGATLNLDLEGVEPMRGQHYEGWNIVNGEAISTGRFSVGKDGGLYSVDVFGKKIAKIGDQGRGSFSISDVELQSKVFVLTIEPNGDSDVKPSSVHLMGGDYSNSTTDLTTGHGSSLGVDLQSVSGSFITAAPTGGAQNQGVWFLDPAAGSGSLDIPELPDAWVYEGWIVNTSNGKKFSTGIFRRGDGGDSDGAGPLAGPLKLSFPPVPGQDIVKSPVVLDDGIHAIVVSVEPYPDFDSAPFAIKILKADVAMGAPGMTVLPLTTINVAPSGTASLLP